ncbi:MAG: alpha/beta hydrolase [Bacteroidota bacterium]
MAKILFLHGNGGGKSRFRPFLKYIHQQDIQLDVVVPDLSGFEGRPFPRDKEPWDILIEDISSVIDPDENWILYGHGIGGSMLLEWASRGFPLANGDSLSPQKVILHSIIGASLHKRFFPKLMKPLWIRKGMQAMIASPALRPMWARRLFRNPSEIAPRIIHRFFDDYKSCEAFPMFFDIITPAWYQEIQSKLGAESYLFIWGGEERVIKAKYLDLWKKDFPNSEFVIFPSWDHFPMLDDIEDFTEKMLNFLKE